MDSKLVNVRISSSIAAWLDEQVEQGIYKSRSEAIREFVRVYIKETAHER